MRRHSYCIRSRHRITLTQSDAEPDQPQQRPAWTDHLADQAANRGLKAAV